MKTINAKDLITEITLTIVAISALVIMYINFANF